MPKTMNAALVRAFGQPLTIEEVAVPTPGPGEVLVKIVATGVCHTDLHAADGDWPVKPTPPFTPGHEGAGTVAALYRHADPGAAPAGAGRRAYRGGIARLGLLGRRDRRTQGQWSDDMTEASAEPLPLDGLKLETFGSTTRAALSSDPPAFVIRTGPVTAPEGTVVLSPPVTPRNEPDVVLPAPNPVNLSDVTPTSVVPRNVRDAPAVDSLALIESIRGRTPRYPDVVNEPLGAATDLGPVRRLEKRNPHGSSGARA